MYFRNCRLQKRGLDKYLKSTVSEDPTTSNMVNGPKHCRRQHLYHIYWSMWKKISHKESLVVICEVLQLFDNRLTANNKYSLLHCDNLTQPIQMILFRKRKNFLIYFLHFSNLDWNSNILKTKVNLIAFLLTKLRIPKDVVRKMSKKSRGKVPTW